MSHGQSNIEREFSVSKEVLQHNLQEKSLVSQRLIYETIYSSDVKLHEFVITFDLRKSCKFSCQRYQQDLDGSKQQKEKIRMDLKRKSKTDELEQRAGLEQETLKAEANQDLDSLAKAASFVILPK